MLNNNFSSDLNFRDGPARMTFTAMKANRLCAKRTNVHVVHAEGMFARKALAFNLIQAWGASVN